MTHISKSASTLAAVVSLTVGLSVANSNWTPFESPSAVDETRHQIEVLPKDDIWWAVNGKDMAWNFKNLQRFLPTVSVYRDGPVRELKYRLNPAIAEHEVDTPNGAMPYLEFLDSDSSTTMGMVILHKGRIVFEHYPRMKEHEKPLYWSVTKVFVSAVVAILEDRGLVDVGKPIETYIPELAESSYAGITVRNILDMASGLDCTDNYVDRSSCYYRFAVTVGDGFWNEDSPDNPYEMLANLDVDRVAEQGTSFDYSGVNTFVLGWLVEKITAMPFQDALTREIWSRIGAEGDAMFFAPRFGVPVTDGGLMAKLRDVARFGLLFTPSCTVVSDERIISDRFVKLIKDGGNPALLKNARYPGWSDDSVKHNVYQWDLVYENNDFYKGGWAGQGLLVNPDRDLVAVWTGYFKDDKHSEVRPLPVLRAVLEGVYGDQ
jgi:CubicO group peptidase (beta-lactamase class C family)